MNRTILVGRLAKELTLKKTNKGDSVLNFTIAVNRSYTNENGERETDFINCVAWGKNAENMVSFVNKGSMIGVDGKIQTRSYEDANLRRVYVTEIFVDNVQFLDNKNTIAVSHEKNNDDLFTDFTQEKSNKSISDISFDEFPF